MAAAQIVGGPTKQALVGGVKQAKPGWMLPLPKADRGRGFLPVHGRGPLRDGDAERPVDAALRRATFADELADAALYQGEAEQQMRERLEQGGFVADQVEDFMRAGGEFAQQRARRQNKLQAWSDYPTTTSGRVEAQNARGRQPGTLTLRQWQGLVDGYGGYCAYCTTPVTTPSIEHVVPVSRDGRTELGNVVPSCGPCNRLKRTKTAKEWLGDAYEAFRVRFEAVTEAVRAGAEVSS